MRLELLAVLLHELVEGKEPVASAALWEPIKSNKTRLSAEYVKAKLKLGFDDQKAVESPTDAIPRYARVNTLLVGFDECLEKLQAQGFKLLDNTTEPSESKCFWRDEHIDNLIVFPPKTDLTKNPLYKDGHLILQDKASCMPAHILSPPPGSIVVDSCSAPGNKTSQLAALVGPTGAVFAFERDPQRFKILQASMDKHKCNKVVATCGDFLKVNPLHYGKIEYALVDPSCSGSGMLESFERDKDKDKSNSQVDVDRLQKLANFQFPNVKRVVYSTCSIHKEENEDVVAEILRSEPSFRLVSNPLPSWPRRGLAGYDFGNAHTNIYNLCSSTCH